MSNGYPTFQTEKNFCWTHFEQRSDEKSGRELFSAFCDEFLKLLDFFKNWKISQNIY